MPGSTASKIAPLFKAESATPTIKAEKDGKLRVTYGNWEDAKVVPKGHALEVRWGSQGVEGRVVALPGPTPSEVILGAVAEARAEVDTDDQAIAEAVETKLRTAGYLIVRAPE